MAPAVKVRKSTQNWPVFDHLAFGEIDTTGNGGLSRIRLPTFGEPTFWGIDHGQGAHSDHNSEEHAIEFEDGTNGPAGHRRVRPSQVSGRPVQSGIHR